MPKLREELQFADIGSKPNKPKEGFSLYNSNGVLKILHADNTEQIIATANMDDIDINITFDDYYKKDQLYTKTEVDDLLDTRLSTLKTGFEVIILESTTLPESGEEGKLYLLPEGDYYKEYLYVNNKWEIVGSTVIDLSGYFDKTETQAEINSITNTKLENYFTKSEINDKLQNTGGKVTFRTWTEV